MTTKIEWYCRNSQTTATTTTTAFANIRNKSCWNTQCFCWLSPKWHHSIAVLFGKNRPHTAKNKSKQVNRWCNKRILLFSKYEFVFIERIHPTLMLELSFEKESMPVPGSFRTKCMNCWYQIHHGDNFKMFAWFYFPEKMFGWRKFCFRIWIQKQFFWLPYCATAESRCKFQ